MAAAAVSGAASFFGINSEDAIINVGICAGDYEPGQVFICNKITEEATGRTFYPDMILRSSLPERELVTVPTAIRKPIHEQEPDLTLEAYINVNTNANKGSRNMALYDMEAAAIYQAANLYVGPHRMGFIKAVSDNGDIEGLTPDFIKKLMAEAVDDIASYVDMFVADNKHRLKSMECNGAADNKYAENVQFSMGDHNICIQKQDVDNSSLHDEMRRTGECAQFTNQLCKDLHCSKVMENQVRQLIKYLSLEGTDYMTYINKLYDEGKLPAHDKKNGKVCLDEIKRELL